MGNAQGAPNAERQDPQTFLNHLVDPGRYVFRNILGDSGKVLKSIKCQVDGEQMVIFRVFNIHQYGDMADELKKLSNVVEDIRGRFNLYEHPGVLPPSRIETTEDADKAYLTRQFFALNLYDRLFVHSSLTNIENGWVAFQLLKAMQQMHSVGVRHGDIKSENVLLTTWNWVFLADFAFYKPTFLPADNPAKFNFFFETLKRTSCYLAPERFYNADVMKMSDEPVTEAMDIFSAGCVIAEIFLSGKHALFDLSQLLAYREGQYDPNEIINKIPHEDVRQLVRHMTQLDPSKRWSAEKYLSEWKSTFPPYFGYLYNWFQGLLSPDGFPRPKDKLNRVNKDWLGMVKELVSHEAQEECERRSKGNNGGLLRKSIPLQGSEFSLQQHFTSLSIKHGEGGLKARSESTIHTISDFSDRVKQSVEHDSPSPVFSTRNNASSRPSRISLLCGEGDESAPCYDGQGLTMVIGIVCSCIQNVDAPSEKLTALRLLSEFARFVDDNVKLGRVVPYMVQLLSAPEASVRAMALHSVTDTLQQVTGFEQSDAHVFPDFIMPALRRFPHDDNELVRLSYAQCIASLAETSRRFLDISQLNQQTENNPGQAVRDSSGSFDIELNILQTSVLKEVIDMLTGQSNNRVKRSLLQDITRLCVFMGRTKVNDDLLPHLISVLNDRDWELRAAFFEHIVGVSVFVGKVAFQNYIIPCIETALLDPEETVTQRAVHTLIALGQLGLFDARVLETIVPKLTPLLCHPSPWLRNSTVDFFCCIAENLGPAKTFCFLLPTLKPFLKESCPIVSLDRSALLRALKPPLSRRRFLAEVNSPSAKARRYLRHTNESKEGEGQTAEDPMDVPQMKEYISRVAASMQQFGDSDDEEEAALQAYANVQDDLELHAVEFVPSLLEPLDSSNLEQVTQELYNSLGLALKFDKEKEGAPVVDSKDSLKRNAKGLPSGRFNSGNRTQTPVTEKKIDIAPYTEVSRKILRALKIPPAPLDLGRCIQKTSSTSCFFVGQKIKSAPDAMHPIDWRPQSNLLYNVNEHKESVNKLAVARDNLFLASASDDGTVKIWRFHNNHTPNKTAEQTYTQGGKITTMCVCDGSHSVAAGSTNGTIHVFKVEYSKQNDSHHRSGWALANVKKVETQEGPVRAVEHMHTVSESLLTYATTRGYIHGWDLRSKTEAFKWKTDDQHGCLSALSLSRLSSSLTTGSNRGYVCLWDIRYHLPVQEWRHSSKSKIVYLENMSQPILPADAPVRDTKAPTVMVSAAGSNQLGLFDLYSGECQTVFRVQPIAHTHLPDYIEKYNRTKSKGITRTSTMTSMTQQRANTTRTMDLPYLATQPGKFSSRGTHIEQMFVNDLKEQGVGVNPHNPYTISSALTCPGAYVVTAGTDAVVRFWDMRDAEASYRVSSPPAIPSASQNLVRVEHSTMVFEERITDDREDDRKADYPTRGPVALPTNHMDYIMDIKALEHPQKMLATACRDGSIKVWA